MKKTLVAGLVMLSFAAIPVQAGNYSYAGCGLGAVIWGKNNNRAVQTLATTTNSTFYSQSLGITSGTSECTDGGVAKKEMAREIFVAANLKDVTREMAAGQGEFVTALGTLSGCTQNVLPDFLRAVQNHYQTIVPTATTEARQIVHGLDNVIAHNAILSESCKG
ncbi:MAG TPA: hypothetical protein DCM05_16835 [Elusimicrobia bacterium]|nr:hypothetical protein [Elusimicrobiota bacterium]